MSWTGCAEQSRDFKLHRRIKEKSIVPAQKDMFAAE